MFQNNKHWEVIGLDIRPTLRSTFLQGGLFSEACIVYFSNGKRKRIYKIDELIWYPPADIPTEQTLKACCDRADAKSLEIERLFQVGAALVAGRLKGGRR